MAINTPSGERRLERACRYVSDLWFPANPALVSKIRATLNTDGAVNLIDELLLDIRSDFSLYTYCLKELLQLLEKEGVSAPKKSNPLELLRWAGIDRLRQILDGEDVTVSKHFFDGMSDVQRSRMEEAVISASAAQVLAATKDLDPELGFSTALLRQLGLTLIAWNYPGVYSEAISRIKSCEGDLDVVIAQILGFTPSALAVALAQRWQLPAEIYTALEVDNYRDAEDIEIEIEVEAVGRSLSQICRVGEALARANRPDVYPTARADWEMARAAIERDLGPRGISVIQAAVQENSLSYLDNNPEFFRGGLILDPEHAILEYERSTLTARNPYLDRCRPFTRSKLLRVYDLLAQGKEAEEALRLLARDVIPAAGFSGGAVYTIDAQSSQLIPQLQIGALALRDMKAVPTALDKDADLVAVAWLSDQPVTKNNQRAGEVSLTCFAAIFGYSQRVGVLYLEIPQLMVQGSEDFNLTHVKAFAATLNDCFALK